MSRKNKYLIQTCLFLLVFIGLLLVGTFYDLEISNLLASGGLDTGAYYSTNVFGRFLEYFGSWPIFIFGIFACLVFMHKIYNRANKTKYLAILLVLINVVVAYKGLSDTFEYICENHYIEHIYESSLTKIILWGLSILIIMVLIFFYRKVDIEKNDKLFNFALVILFTCLFYVFIEVIKGPMGRMRFRAMNLVGDFNYFTNWYEISDAKELVFATGAIVPNDGFKSFPSGHTFAAGVSYVLICMPYIFKKFDTKKWHIIWYLIPICFTGLVGLSRIVVGAHFLSDVVVGGTIAYIAAELFKYLFIVRKSNKNG